MIWLAVGMTGLGLVLTIVIDELFGDWNAAVELRDAARAVVADWFHRREGRTEDWLLDLEKARETDPNVRLIDRRREQLRELASVEQRMLPSASADRA